MLSTYIHTLVQKLAFYVVCLVILHTHTVLKTIYIARDNSNNLKMSAGDLSASISVADPSQPATSSNNLLAYRPNYSDYHSSGLAGLFINLDGVFPCNAGHGIPTCGRFTVEEDGFNKGKALLQAADGGNNFGGIFGSSSTRVYGFAFQECAENCIPAFYEIRVVCLLPREYCG